MAEVVGYRTLLTTLATMSDAPAQRLLLVHAHPDDESIGTGATMASYADRGVGVTLVTCTAGEMGEILVPEWSHKSAEQDDTLGEHRREALLLVPGGDEHDRVGRRHGAERSGGTTQGTDRMNRPAGHRRLRLP